MAEIRESLNRREETAVEVDAATFSLIIKVFKNLPGSKLFIASPYYVSELLDSLL
jgi:hypothetical protein